MDPKKCCGTCAFGKPGGAGAASETNNRLEALICAQGGIPFYCHHKPDGAEWNWQSGLIGFSALRPHERRICAGWKAAVQALFATGWRKQLSERYPADRRPLLIYQRNLAQTSLRELRRFLCAKGKRAKAKAKVDLRESLLATFSK